tara:strand:+ start:2474 stop:3643 length:1170 start_codon:yes stop_codon:yes gene_type:complete
MSLRTGQKVVTKLRKYINGYATTEVKNNTSGDPDYIAPFTDEESCPKYQIETIVTPSPSPVGFDIVPAPIGVSEDPPPDQSTVCAPCFTRDLPENECKTYEIRHSYQFNQPGVDPGFMDASYSYTNCENNEVIEGELSPGGVVNINSLRRPDIVYGPGLVITEGQVVAGFSNIDINQYHYLASGCYDSDDRFLRSTTQFNVGDIVKTANSTCCWEIIQLVSPRPAYNIIFNSSSDVFSSCATCCDLASPSSTYGQEPTDAAVITGGNVSLTHTYGFGIPITKVFQVTGGGLVEIKLTVQRTSGNYVNASARVKQSDGLTKNAIAEFPLHRSSKVLNYVENKDPRYGGTGNDVVESKVVNLEAGVYRAEIDALVASSNAVGSATLTINVK